MNEKSTSDTDLLDTEAAARLLGKSASWLNRARSNGRGPRYIRVGGTVRYRHFDIDAYLADSTVETVETRQHAARSGKAAA